MRTTKSYMENTELPPDLLNIVKKQQKWFFLDRVTWSDLGDNTAHIPLLVSHRAWEQTPLICSDKLKAVFVSCQF